MTKVVIDTNVPIVANGSSMGSGGRGPSASCREATIRFLMQIRKSGRVLLDQEGAVQAEYRRHLNPSGQPGVGDRFYQEVLNSSPNRVERIDLAKRADGEYLDLPQALIDANFDPSDRKFAALAKRTGAPVANAVDSDWHHHQQILAANGIRVDYLCGCDPMKWFEKR